MYAEYSSISYQKNYRDTCIIELVQYRLQSTIIE